MKVKADSKFIADFLARKSNQFDCEMVDQDVQEILYRALKYIAYTWTERHITKPEQYHIFFTKNDKRVTCNVFNSAMDRDERLFELLSSAEDQIKVIKSVKERDALAKAKMINSVSIGDIFVTTWGYDQTNVEAFQVVEKKSKTVTLAEINTEMVPGTDGTMCCNVIPVKDSFIKGEQKIKKLIGPNGIRLASYKSARKWDGKSSYYSSWYA